jgi:hypothetical protein
MTFKRIYKLGQNAVERHFNTTPIRNRRQIEASPSDKILRSTVTRSQLCESKPNLAVNRYLAMPIAQNASIGVALLCPSDSLGNDTMDMGAVVDRKGFVSRSKEENAATATLERAAAAEYLSSFEPGQKNQLLGRGDVKRFAVHFRLRDFEIGS